MIAWLMRARTNEQMIHVQRADEQYRERRRAGDGGSEKREAYIKAMLLPTQ